MSVLTAEEMTDLYLYGTKEKPTDLLDTNIMIRPTDARGEVTVDINDYMQDIGRFVNPASFNLLEIFFTNQLAIDKFIESGQIKKGERYTEIQMREKIEKLGYSTNVTAVRIQKEYGIDDSDYAERTYIWNSTSFEIADDSLFVVLEDGTCQVENFALIPTNWKENKQQALENFDFISDDSSASIGGSILEPLIDPLGIGRTVDIYFDGTPKRTTITLKDYLESKKNKPTTSD